MAVKNLLSSAWLPGEPVGSEPCEDGRWRVHFGRVPRVYIETLRDNAVTLELQRQMQRRHPCRKVIAMDTSHSPFLSVPAELAAQLLSL